MAGGRRRLPMPELDEWPRVGKIRLGEKVEGKNKETGESFTRPSAIDYFRVDAEDGITSPEAAASFHEVYGDRPRALKCRLPGPTAESVFEGAWRLYGTRKLKRVCDGETCDERTTTGGWDSSPCKCGERRYISPTPKGVCQLSWTLSVLLPDVVGMGVWQIDTGSEISVKRVSRWLQMMEKVAGDLMFLEFTLNLAAVDVNPGGRSSTVHVLDPRAVSATPQELLGGGGRVVPQIGAGSIPGPEVPAPAADEAPEDAFEGEIVTPRWGEVLDDLRRMAPDLDDTGIGRELADCFGRRVQATELDDPEISGRAIRHFLERQEKREATRRDLDDETAAAPMDPPIPGQETLA